MKRNIIKIAEDKCNGCGLCMPNCPEGAIQIIDDKARLISDLFCDGLGACIGHCPEGAITIEEREAVEYDEKKTMENIIKAGSNVIKAHLKHLQDHGQTDFYNQALEVLKDKNIEVSLENEKPSMHSHEGGCPGMKMMDFRKEQTSRPDNKPAVSMQSELRQWPIQLKLLNPQAPYFKGADLLIAADCAPFTYANFHQKFLKGKILVIFCPKLDDGLEGYVEKLAAILKNSNIKSITTVHMEVPCCSGVVGIVEKALEKSGKNIIVKDYTVSLQGELI
ncbi:MAG: 4Fe-4S binding protein [Candidatus Omnitrophota bacterium]